MKHRDNTCKIFKNFLCNDELFFIYVVFNLIAIKVRLALFVENSKEIYIFNLIVNRLCIVVI